MSRQLYTNTDDDADAMRQKQLRFYALVGICVSDYQAIEDRLESLFKSALEIDEHAAHDIFLVAKGLEDKCKLIAGALKTRNENLRALWDDLQKRIKAAADKRSQIAHASSVFGGRGIVIGTADDGEPKIIGYTKPHSEMKLEKKTKSGVVHWDAKMLATERSSLEELSRHLTVLFRILVDGSLDPRFFDWWRHPLIEGAMK